MRRLLPVVLVGAFAMFGVPGVCIGPAAAQQPAIPPTTTAAAKPASPGAADRLSDADLEELLAPIALYPDPLLANVLTAACYPDEIAEAAKANGNAALIDAADWEAPVKAVAKIPDAMTMMTQYADWTAAIGEAFILQSADVMKAVQNLRARAYANGSLQTNQQQVVQPQGDTIIIEPAQPDVIYVPSYNPSVVYVDDDDDEVVAGVIGFGVGVATGLIIANNIDCDWWGGGCCHGCGWGHGHGDVDIDINRGDINIDNSRVNNIKNNGNTWKPNQSKLSQGVRSGQGQHLSNYKGAGSGARTGGQVPGRTAGAKPIAQRPAPRASQVSKTSRPTGGGTTRTPAKPSSTPKARPSSMSKPSSAPKAKPSIPPSNRAGGAGSTRAPSAASRPSTSSASRPSAYSGGGNRAAASRGSSSRSSSGGSRGGGGGRGGGGRR